ncbi:MAG: hypothetical protein ABEH88_11820 [Halobacteriales archaeon]
MESAPFRQRLLERVCERRAALTIAFVFAGLLFSVSIAIFLFADVSPSSNIIALVDAVLSGIVLVSSGFVLRTCNRFQRNE